MSVHKPVDIVFAVSQSLWVLAMCVFKPGDIVIAVSQSLWVLAVYVYKPVDIVIAVNKSLWELAMCLLTHSCGDTCMVLCGLCAGPWCELVLF